MAPLGSPLVLLFHGAPIRIWAPMFAASFGIIPSHLAADPVGFDTGVPIFKCTRTGSMARKKTLVIPWIWEPCANKGQSWSSGHQPSALKSRVPECSLARVIGPSLFWSATVHLKASAWKIVRCRAFWTSTTRRWQSWFKPNVDRTSTFVRCLCYLNRTHQLVETSVSVSWPVTFLLRISLFMWCHIINVHHYADNWKEWLITLNFIF